MGLRPTNGNESLPTCHSEAKCRSQLEDFAGIGTRNLLFLLLTVKSRFFVGRPATSSE